MSLTLSIRNVARLDNGAPTELVLHKRGALIGRSPTCDWCLPDARNYISSRHCEVRFADGFYILTDISTNGTILNHDHARMAEPRRIVSGDRFMIGDFEVVATLSGEASAAHERAEAEAQASLASNWQGWDGQGDVQQPVEDPGAGWGQTPTAPDPYAPNVVATPGFASGWAPSHRAPDNVPAAASVWDQPKNALEGASEWSSAAPDRPPPPSADDVWGKLNDGYVVDWARGGFGQPSQANHDPLGLSPQPAAPAANAGWAAPAAPMVPPPPPSSGWSATPSEGLGSFAGAPPQAAPQAPGSGGFGGYPAAAPAHGHQPAPGQPPFGQPAPGQPPAAPPSQTHRPGMPGGASLDTLFQQLGVNPEQVEGAPEETLARTGALMRQLIAGLVLMVEARARAKSQMGAEATSFGFDGNNPLKFARTPEQAITQLLNPPARGFMDSGPAIDDAFRDLQAHQMATLKAMQGALRATLERFSPTSIRGRVETGGISKLLPGAKEAALWQAYEKEFSGVAHGSDEAFMEVFAKEFRHAYDEQSRKR